LIYIANALYIKFKQMQNLVPVKIMSCTVIISD